MTIHLSSDLERFVHGAVRDGHYATEDDVVNDALARLEQSLPAPQKKPITREEFDKHLLAIGLLSQLPDTSIDFDDPDDEPIAIKGEPLSETVIRERR
jgi:Arc/MetJ-type ribon-helix-helix transcriptional regulator